MEGGVEARRAAGRGKSAAPWMAFTIVGLYAVVVLSLLGWGLFSKHGDPGLFFKYMAQANFLLGPVGFVLGYYFKKEAQDDVRGTQ